MVCAPAPPAVILENHHIPHPLIPVQVKDTSHISSDYVNQFIEFQFVEVTVMSGCFRDDLMCSHAVHQVVESISTSSQFAFDSQSRIAIGHDPHGPARPVGRQTQASDGKDFRRGTSFVVLTEWAEAAVLRKFLELQVYGCSTSVSATITQRSVKMSLRIWDM